MKTVVILTLLLGLFPCFAQQSSDAFTVTANDKNFHVIAPVGWKQGTSMVLQNKTLVTIYGEVLAGSERRKVDTFSVKPNQFISMDLTLKKGETAVLVPMSPPFQEVILQFGRRPYEIPPQR